MGSYVFALIVDPGARANVVSSVAGASWFGLPVFWENTVFGLFSRNVDTSLLWSSVFTIVPLSLATTLASLFGAPANTTYGENTGVLALTKVYDPAVVRIAAVLAILFAFCPKFEALVSAMPTATIGGVSLVLYGMISAVGVRNVVENQVDFTNTRNVIIAALILVLAIGITYTGSIQIGFVSLSGLAVASITGIVLNAVLPGKDYEFAQESEGSTSVNFQV